MSAVGVQEGTGNVYDLLASPLQHQAGLLGDNGHRHGQDIEHATEQIYQKRNADEHPDDIETATRVIAALRTRLALVRHTTPPDPILALSRR